MANQPKTTTFIDPFVDFAFKRIFASEESKAMGCRHLDDRRDLMNYKS